MLRVITCCTGTPGACGDGGQAQTGRRLSPEEAEKLPIKQSLANLCPGSRTSSKCERRSISPGWETDTSGLRLGAHERGRGPGDTGSLPYFTADPATTLGQVRELGGSIIHPGERWAICRDSEGSPFALAAESAPTT